MDDERNGTLSNMLEFYRASYLKGDKAALLEAVEYCGMFKIIMPDWVVYEFTQAHRKWKYIDVETLDEAFQVERKNGFRKAYEKELINKSFGVFLDILNADHKDTETVDDIAIKHGINRDKAWKMYVDIKDNNTIGKGLYKAFQNKKKSSKSE